MERGSLAVTEWTMRNLSPVERGVCGVYHVGTWTSSQSGVAAQRGAIAHDDHAPARLDPAERAHRAERLADGLARRGRPGCEVLLAEPGVDLDALRRLRPALGELVDAPPHAPA